MIVFWIYWVKSNMLFKFRDFPGSLVVKTLPSNAGCASLIPSLGAKISCALLPENQVVE